MTRDCTQYKPTGYDGYCPPCRQDDMPLFTTLDGAQGWCPREGDLYPLAKTEPAPHVLDKGVIHATLHTAYPHGDPAILEAFLRLIKLHSDKNHDYAGPVDGATTPDPLGNFNRGAAIMALYPGLDPAKPAHYAAILMLKQLDAVLNFLATQHEARVEGIASRLDDVSVYAQIIARLVDKAAL